MFLKYPTNLVCFLTWEEAEIPKRGQNSAETYLSGWLRSGLLGLCKFCLGTFNLWMFTDNNSHSPEYKLSTLPTINRCFHDHTVILVSVILLSQALAWSFFFFFWPQASLVPQNEKNLPVMQENPVWSLGKEVPWRREWLPTPVFLPAEFHGQRSLEGYSPWGHKESDTAKWLTLTFCSIRDTFYILTH